ncbi:SGNH/GDSL hydrolase family protein [Aeromonas hydrophila]|uniref:SGNH/GDSL hydrolase family protein n=1 Tax=Aeromonas hydrophila TaxID=644 RepID=UPI0021F4CAC6|nr:SGNH/GDSL hydrolase family protein [Aeromonas hydrophila]MCV9384629.1 SGNH/GDSL hydrolase family protein [Aeromonas hydrophila]
MAQRINVKSLSPRFNVSAAPWANGKKCSTFLGDSIGHGAFAGNLFSHGITRLLARALNAEFGTSSYGFTPMLALGIGQSYESRDIHDVIFTNAGSGWVGQDAAAGAAYLNGFAFRSTDTGNKISFSLPSFQRRAVIHHANQTGGGTFTIKVNGTVVATVNTGISTNKFAVTEVDAADNKYGVVLIELETTNSSPVDVCGISYFSSQAEHVLQNFSQSGRRARNLSTAVINEICAHSSTLIFALGHNDYAETDQAYIDATAANIDALIAAANLNKVSLVVPDFCWVASSTANWMRLQLQRLATETGGIYIPFPDLLRKPNGSQPDSNYLVNELGMWVDGSHPNVTGCQWIFETIAKSMGLSCTSKQEALTQHDYWVPLPLIPATSVENSVPSAPSACKRTPSGIMIRFYIEANPAVAFPVGDYQLCNSFAARTDIVGSSMQMFPVLRPFDFGQDTALIGGVIAGPSGSILMDINLTGTYNDLYFSFIIP